MTGRIIVDTDVLASNEQKGLSGFFVARRRWPIRLPWCPATGLQARKRFLQFFKTGQPSHTGTSQRVLSRLTGLCL
jgi:hypothetical protein